MIVYDYYEIKKLLETKVILHIRDILKSRSKPTFNSCKDIFQNEKMSFEMK